MATVRQNTATSKGTHMCVEELTKLRRIAEFFMRCEPWEHRHAAENRYCPYCGNHPDIDSWTDQKEHHPSCEWLQIQKLWESING